MSRRTCCVCLASAAAVVSLVTSIAFSERAYAGGGLTGTPPASVLTEPTIETPRADEPVTFGDPIPGLTLEQLERFNVGEELFIRTFEGEEGLGPVFNKDSCGGCHNLGGTGGAGTITVTRIGRFPGKGQFDPMIEFGGPVQQAESIPEDGSCAEEVPEEAQLVIQRLTTPTFGSGLIEAIPDDTILALEDPDDADGDGISGRAHMVFDPISEQMRVGRFGWKSQQATVAGFTADAQLNELGITNRIFTEDNDPNGIFPPELADCDMADDPEDAPDEFGVSDFDRMTDFQRFLAPPPRKPLLDARGSVLFREVGCADCHVPVLFTGDSDVEALAHRPVFLFSDLLLHDMGALGDEFVDGDAEGTEMRTAPLWGLRARTLLLHDGRSDSEDALERMSHAIEQHAGEASAARDAWLALPEQDKQDLLEFLDSI